MRVLDQEMTRRDWTKEMKNEMVRRSFKDKRNRGFDIDISPCGLRIESPFIPVFSPFIDLSVNEAFEACLPCIDALLDFLKKGKYKWRRHKVFRTFLTSMQRLQLLAGPEEEGYKVAALISYKEIARQLGISKVSCVLYFDGKDIESPRAHEFKLREAYALVEFLQASNQAKQASLAGRMTNAALFEKVFTIHMRAAVQLKEISDEASHVRMIGLEPNDYDDSHTEQSEDESEDDESDGERGIQILDYYHRRKVAHVEKILPENKLSNVSVDSKTQHEVSEKKSNVPAGSETELMRDIHSFADKEKTEDVEELDDAAKTLRENNTSNISIASETQPDVTEKKTSAIATLETGLTRDIRSTAGKDEPKNIDTPEDKTAKFSPEAQDEISGSRNQAPANSVEDRNESKVDVKDLANAAAEKENKPSAREGFEYSPRDSCQCKSRTKGNPSDSRVACGDTAFPFGDGQLKDTKKDNDTSVRCICTAAPLDVEENIPGLRTGAEQCNASAAGADLGATASFTGTPLPGDMIVPCVDTAALDVEKNMPDLVVDMQNEISALRARNEKVVANLRNKKSLLEQAAKRNAHLQEEIRSKERNLHSRIASLRGGIENVSASRDNLKNKLRIEKELLAQARMDKEKLQHQLKQSEKARAMERELLDLYRVLGNHTGYYNWGKRIRILEGQLSEQQNSAAD